MTYIRKRRDGALTQSAYYRVDEHGIEHELSEEEEQAWIDARDGSMLA